MSGRFQSRSAGHRGGRRQVVINKGAPLIRSSPSPISHRPVVKMLEVAMDGLDGDAAGDGVEGTCIVIVRCLVEGEATGKMKRQTRKRRQRGEKGVVKCHRGRGRKDEKGHYLVLLWLAT